MLNSQRSTHILVSKRPRDHKASTFWTELGHVCQVDNFWLSSQNFGDVCEQ